MGLRQKRQANRRSETASGGLRHAEEQCGCSSRCCVQQQVERPAVAELTLEECEERLGVLHKELVDARTALRHRERCLHRLHGQHIDRLQPLVAELDAQRRDLLDRLTRATDDETTHLTDQLGRVMHRLTSSRASLDTYKHRHDNLSVPVRQAQERLDRLNVEQQQVVERLRTRDGALPAAPEAEVPAEDQVPLVSEAQMDEMLEHLLADADTSPVEATAPRELEPVNR